MQAKSKLYGRRVKGDLDLGLEPSRITPALLRAWARMDVPGGLLPGGTRQEIWELSVLQNYQVGTRRAMDDRVFHYAHTNILDLICPRGRPVIATDNAVETGHFTGALVAGTYTCTWVVQAAAGIIANQYQNGWFFSDGVAYRVLANTANTIGNLITLTLDRPIQENRAGAWSHAMLLESPYANVATRRLPPFTANPGLVVGVKITDDLPGTPNRWEWIQTWGPCCLMVNNITQGNALGEAGWTDVRAGAAAEEANPEVVTAAFSYQRIGYNIPRNVVNNVDDQFAAVYLIIAP